MATGGTESKYFVTKLNGKNYYVWKVKMEMILLKEGSWNAIAQEQPSPSTEAWKKMDGNARASIILSMEDELIGNVTECTTAKEIWHEIKKTYEHTSLMSKNTLRRSFYASKKSSNVDMVTHVTEVMCLANRLKHMGDKIADDQIVSTLLCSLPAEYSSLITALDARDPEDLTLEFVKLKLIDEAARNETKPETSEQNTALYTYKNSREKVYNNRQCFNCGMTGHLQRNCFKNEPNKGNRYLKRIGESTCSRDKEEYMQQKLAFAQNEVTENKQDTQSENEKVFGAFSAALNGPETAADEWMMDTGANAHMTFNKEFFIEYKELKQKKIITLAGGEKLDAIGIGTCVIGISPITNEQIKLYDVLFIPDLHSNLMSLGQLSEEGNEVIFGKTECTVYMKASMVIKGDMKNRLYIFKGEQVYIAEKGMATCVHDWHRKLGHRSTRSILEMKKAGVVNGLEISNCDHDDGCRGCYLGGMINKPFNKKQSLDDKLPFKHIFSDVCGEISPRSLGGGAYFITITDYYSKYCDVKIITHKHESTQIIKDYINENYNRYGYFPISLTTDGGGEYENKELNQYLQSKGIKHRLTIPYSPQENGISERKNRTLMTMVRSMIANNGLPNYLWGEAVVTACHISNRVQHFTTLKTPYELWTGKIPNVKDLIEFGSVVYSYIDKSIRSKLDSTSQKGLFVGYNDRQTGYRVWLPEKRRVISSRNVKVSSEEHGLVFDNTELLCKNMNEVEVIFDDEQSNDSSGCLNVRRSERCNKGIPAERWE